MKKTARKIADVDEHDKTTERGAQQPAEIPTHGEDVEMAAGEEGDKSKRRRRRAKRTWADHKAEQNEEGGEQQQQHKTRHQKDRAAGTRSSPTERWQHSARLQNAGNEAREASTATPVRRRLTREVQRRTSGVRSIVSRQRCALNDDRM